MHDKESKTKRKNKATTTKKQKPTKQKTSGLLGREQSLIALCANEICARLQSPLQEIKRGQDPLWTEFTTHLQSLFFGG